MTDTSLVEAVRERGVDPDDLDLGTADAVAQGGYP